MELKDFLGVAGFIIAAYNFIQTLIKKPKLVLVAGPSFETYYKPDGATGFYIPIAFINEGGKPGKVISLYLIIKPPNSKTTFQMRWNQFVKHDNKNKTFEHLNYVNAFSVSAQTVNDKFVYFLWDATNSQLLQFHEGEYQMEFLLDQSTSSGSNKKFMFLFNISKEDVNFFETDEAKAAGRTRVITIKNYEKENVLK
jgi:hypothetical protein